MSSATWCLVQPEVAKFTRVCSYDRAFLGQSDAGPAPRTSQMIVDDLRALLQNAGIPGPYVLVGWSFGGFSMHLMARQDGGHSVIGMVLVDATPVQWIEVAERLGLPVPAPGQTPEQVDLWASAAQLLGAPPSPTSRWRCRPMRSAAPTPPWPNRRGRSCRLRRSSSRPAAS